MLYVEVVLLAIFLESKNEIIYSYILGQVITIVCSFSCVVWVGKLLRKQIKFEKYIK